MRQLAVFICLFFSFTATLSQRPVFVHYGISEGLPGKEVFSITSDSIYNLYFGTNKGLVKFDGTKFISLYNESRFSIPSVLRLVKDPHERIWAFSFGGQIHYLEGNILHQKTFPQLSFTNTRSFGESLRLDENNDLTVGYKSIGVVSSNPSIEKEYNQLPQGIYLDLSKSSPLLFTIIPPKETLYDTVHVYTRISQEWNIMSTQIITGTEALRYTVRYNGNILLGTPDYIYEVDKGTGYAIDSFPGLPKIIYEDRQERIWVSMGLFEGQPMVSKPGGKLSTLEVFPSPENQIITDILQDHEDGYWFTTENNGVFYTPGLHTQFYDHATLGSDRPNATFFGKDDQGNVFSVTGHKITEWSGNKIVKQWEIPFDIPPGFPPVKIMGWGSHNIAIFGKAWLYVQNNGEEKFWDLGFTLSFNCINGKNLVVGNHVGILHIIDLDDYESHFISLKPHLQRIENVLAIDTNDFYVGSLNGLFHYHKGKVDFMGTKFYELSHRISTLQYFHDWLVAGTADAKIVFSRDDSCIVLNADQYSEDHWIHSVFVDKGHIWISGNDHLSKISTPLTVPSFRNFSYAHGLIDHYFTDVLSSNGYVYTSAENGIFIFEEAYFKPDHTSPFCIFTAADINGSILDILQKNRLVLDYNQNNIRLYFENKSFRLGNDRRYRYKIQGISDEYLFTREEYISLTGLRPGKYEILLETRNANGFWSEPVIFTIVIRPHWTGTWQFRLLLLLAVAAIAGLIMLLYIRWIRHRNAEKILLLQSQQIALARLMNPHFIFNVMNSLQGLILQEAKRKAAALISDFSKVMRLSIESTRYKYAPLISETEILKKYMKIEQIQYQDKFEFQILIPENVFNQNIRIPPMLLQPFVENSIKHGIQHLKEKGNIIISFEWKEQMLICTIEDNGIGIKKTQEIRQVNTNRHKSAGMSITQTRLKLLHKDNRSRYFFELNDLDDATKTGTRLRFSLPYQKHYDESTYY